MLQQHKKHEYSARLKKFYSTMQQASIRAKADGNPWDDWANSNNKDSRDIEITQQFQEKYLLPYLSNTKRETVADTHAYIYLSDGSYFSNNKGKCLDFRFDVNGNKKPNQQGRDQFIFLFCSSDSLDYIKQGTFIPYQAKTIKTRKKALENCITNAKTCSTLLMMDGWEFKDDYPYSL